MNPGFLAAVLFCLMPHTNVPQAENRASSVCCHFRRGVHLGLGLGASSLSTARSWFPGSGHQAADRNPAYRPPGDLCIDVMERQLCCWFSDECLSGDTAQLKVLFH